MEFRPRVTRGVCSLMEDKRDRQRDIESVLPRGSPVTIPTTNIAAAVVVVLVVVDEAFEVAWFRRPKACPRPRTARPPHLAGRVAGLSVTLPPLLWSTMCLHASLLLLRATSMGFGLRAPGLGAESSSGRESNAAELTSFMRRNDRCGGIQMRRN